jgi:V-type H+-transporting ATPase subunit a
MFGDIGHGILMTLSAFTLIMLEKKFTKGTGSEVSSRQTLSSSNVLLTRCVIQIFDTFYYGRYIIFLMGLFAIYTGFLYNDIFSLSLRIFPSGWKWPSDFGSGPVEALSTGRTYFMGLDPEWHGSDNILIFTNSLKMKMSVVMGVIHVRRDPSSRTSLSIADVDRYSLL